MQYLIILDNRVSVALYTVCANNTRRYLDEGREQRNTAKGMF